VWLPDALLDYVDDQVKELAAEGFGAVEIARRCEIERTSVWRILKDATALTTTLMTLLLYSTNSTSDYARLPLSLI